MSKRFAFAFFFVSLWFTVPASAGVILQNDATAVIFTQGGEAQSFIAEDALVRFAFSYEVISPRSPNGLLELKLVAGDGVGGSLLADIVFTLPSGYTGFYDIDLSSVPLTVGQSYTAIVSTSSIYWGIDAVYTTTGSDPYPDGERYDGSGQASANYPDTRFRVTPIPQAGTPIPEPLTTLLIGTGALGAAALRRRRRTTRTPA